MEIVRQCLIDNWSLLTGGAFLGFGVGILTGLFGAGGGFILTPALNILLRVPMNIAVGTSVLQVFGSSGVALYHHFDKKFLGIRVAAIMGMGIPFGAFLGNAVIEKFKDSASISVMGEKINAMDFMLLIIFAVFLSLIAFWLFLDNFWLCRHEKTEDETLHKGFLSLVKIPPVLLFRTIPGGEFSASVLILLGFGMGFLSGLLGIGGGVIMVPILFYLIGQETKVAARTSMMLVFMSGLFASISHAINRNINYTLVVFLMSGAFLGTKIGIAIQRKTSGKSIRRYFAFIVLGAVIMVIYKLWAMLS